MFVTFPTMKLSFPHVFCGNLLRKMMRFLHKISQEWQFNR